MGEPGGSGLGLSIVAAIADAHDAVISARPGPDGGLSIEVSFAALTPGQARGLFTSSGTDSALMTDRDVSSGR